VRPDRARSPPSPAPPWLAWPASRPESSETVRARPRSDWPVRPAGSGRTGSGRAGRGARGGGPPGAGRPAPAAAAAAAAPVTAVPVSGTTPLPAIPPGPACVVGSSGSGAARGLGDGRRPGVVELVGWAAPGCSVEPEDSAAPGTRCHGGGNAAAGASGCPLIRPTGSELVAGRPPTDSSGSPADTDSPADTRGPDADSLATGSPTGSPTGAASPATGELATCSLTPGSLTSGSLTAGALAGTGWVGGSTGAPEEPSDGDGCPIPLLGAHASSVRRSVSAWASPPRALLPLAVPSAVPVASAAVPSAAAVRVQSWGSVGLVTSCLALPQCTRSRFRP